MIAGNQPAGAFPATAWSLVGRAGSATPAERSAALEALLKRYLPALRARLVLEKGLREAEADDVAQCPDQQRLSQSRRAFQECVTLAEEADQQLFHHVRMTDENVTDLFAQRVECPAECVGLRLHRICYRFHVPQGRIAVK